MLRRISSVRRCPTGMSHRSAATTTATTRSHFLDRPCACLTAGCDALPLPAQALAPPSTLPAAHSAPEVRLNAVAV